MTDRIDDEDKPGMLTIPSGIMPVVDTVGFRPDYSGQHVSEFEISQYAITLAQWLTIMDYLPPDTDHLVLNHPVLNVNWFDIHRYIDKLNKLTGEQYRLPTELEWEYAARGGSANDYCIGLGLLQSGEAINYKKNQEGPVEVGSLPPNKWGCYEMLGNVWEWVSDGGRTVRAMDGIESYELKLLRGGCWASSEFEVKLTSRDEHKKGTNGWNTFGFRVARDIINNN